MSPVTRLARCLDEFRYLFIWEISARSTGMKSKNHNQKIMVEHKPVPFATVIALTIVTLLIQLIRILLKWKYVQDQICAILDAILRKKSFFVQTVSTWLPGMKYSYEISVTGPARLLVWTHRNFTQKRVTRRHLGNQARPVDWAHMKKPSKWGIFKYLTWTDNKI